MHKNTKQVAIILALYNGAAYLADQLDSILNNTFQNFTIHLFDDGSSDPSANIAAEYENNYPDKIFYHRNKTNTGVVKNFLNGAKSLSADYYMFCDQDDVWCKDKIEKSVDFMLELEEKDSDLPLVVFADAKVVNQNLELLSPSFQKQSGYNTSATDLSHLLMENKLIGCTMLFNRPLQKLLSVFPEEIRMHDWWVALLGASFGNVHYLDTPLMLYRQHTDNVVGSVSKTGYIKNRLFSLAKRGFSYCIRTASFRRKKRNHFTFCRTAANELFQKAVCGTALWLLKKRFHPESRCAPCSLIPNYPYSTKRSMPLSAAAFLFLLPESFFP